MIVQKTTRYKVIQYASVINGNSLIYTITMNYAMYKNRAQYWDGFEFYEKFRNLTAEADNIVYLHEGDTFEVMGLDFEVAGSGVYKC